MLFKHIICFVVSSLVLISCVNQKANNASISVNKDKKEFADWKKDRLAALTAPSGWLTITALIWLKENHLTVGTDDQYDITIPYTASANFGTLQNKNNQWSFTPSGESKITVNNKPLIDKVQLIDDQSENTSYLGYESLSWFLIKRGDNYGIRVKDSLNPPRFELESISTFEYNPDYVFDAKVEWAAVSDSILITNAQGVVLANQLKGWLHFQHNEKKQKIAFIDGGADTWFTVFGDETNSGETYGAGRFLYIDVPPGTKSTKLDFNRAENPPCYHTAFATCPLPPRENKLMIKILAGETSSH